MTEHHTHAAIRTSAPKPFRGPVAGWPAAENVAAHGNVEITETCSCGLVRECLVNGQHTEDGPWHESEEARAQRQAQQQRRQTMEARRQRAAEMMATAERNAAGRRPARLLVKVAQGVELDITGTDGAALLRDSTEIGVMLSSPWAPSRTRCTLGELRQAARDWADAPSEPAHDLYTAIAAALP